MAQTEYVAVFSSVNWADEMDIKGMSIFEKSDWEEHLADFRKEDELLKAAGHVPSYNKTPWRSVVGSNQHVEWHSFDDKGHGAYHSYMNSFRVVKLTEQDVHTFVRLTGARDPSYVTIGSFVMCESAGEALAMAPSEQEGVDELVRRMNRRY